MSSIWVICVHFCILYLSPDERWGAGMVICLERGADLHMAQLIPLPLTVSCFSKIQISLPFWYRPTRVVPDKGPLNGCVCVYTFPSLYSLFFSAVTLLLDDRKGVWPMPSIPQFFFQNNNHHFMPLHRSTSISWHL